MTSVCDFSDQSISIPAIKANGLVGIISYCSDAPNPKNLTQANFDEALSLGLTVNLVCEQGNQPALRGAAGGAHDAQISNAQADALGYSLQAAIYYVAEDPNVLPQSDWPTVEAYFRALSGRPVGAYGSLNLVSHLIQLGLAKYGWAVQTWGGTNNLVHLEQLVGANTFGLAIDVDTVLQADYGQHPRPITPSTGGTKMISNIFSFKPGQLDQAQTSLSTLWHKYSEDGGKTWASEPIAGPTGSLFTLTIPTQEPMVYVESGKVTLSVEDSSTNIHHFVQLASGPVNGNWWNKVDVP